MSTGFLLIAIVWLLLQLLALIFLKGPWRIAASRSGGVMLLPVAVGLLGGRAGSSLAPIRIVIALPLCTIRILGVWIAHGVMLLWACWDSTLFRALDSATHRR